MVHVNCPEYGPYVPTGQSKHADEEVAPSFGLYDPAGHGLQADTPTMSLQYPAEQVVHEGCPPYEVYVPTGQSTQAEEETAPQFGLNVPDGHGL